MDSRLLNISAFDPIMGYKILNTIGLSNFKSKFPYSELTPNKLNFAKDKIEIIAKKVDAFKKTNTSSKKEGGNNLSLPIIIYG